MTSIALFHSVLGVRPGITDAAARLRAAGHEVLVVDQYDGRTFDDYGVAGAYVADVGFPALMSRAVEAVGDLPDGFVAAGFSNGAGMAEFVATQRRCAGLLLFSGALPVHLLGADRWPPGLPAQLHHTEGDPFRKQQWLDSVIADARAAGAEIEVHDYPGAGHLFTDPSLPAEYDAAATELLWTRALGFCARVSA
ncbi:dienelactone hydrolase family protein [Blastococcus sp. VKM Ac-2987]|uniref:dienelactone hydrolase family protein n=1 Tax=Blastococcus sp. VKM Ac-2987 TaxID=3004141 RepID=UPI0022ABB9C1|nr:dienelactone hydrolase family protein [Blastococcus sp. VKM Ac-2987]MCZ2859462.1 dienelactone hydrolase family protein [Blastococcus sp. VKM Ac-2987]